MNLTDLKVNLYKHFSENDEFVFPDDCLKIYLISDNDELSRAAVEEALQSFVEAGFVKRVEFCGKTKGKTGIVSKTGYVLVQPLKNYSQVITLSGELCAFIADTLNSLNPNKGEIVSNPLAISHLEIETLAGCLDQFIKNTAEQD